MLNFFSRKKPAVHDYRKQSSKKGHDAFGRWTINADSEREIKKLTGWGRGIHKGDFILMGSGKGGHWQVQAISYYDNPKDMWTASVIRRDPS